MILISESYQFTAVGSIENLPFHAGSVKVSMLVGTGSPFCLTIVGFHASAVVTAYTTVLYPVGSDKPAGSDVSSGEVYG